MGAPARALLQDELVLGEGAGFLPSGVVELLGRLQRLLRSGVSCCFDGRV